MNKFTPQSVQTAVELAYIADVKKQIISPRHSSPIIKLKQDTVLGTYKMTEVKRRIDWHEAMNLAMYTYGTDVYRIKKKDVDSHELYSLIIPPMINYSDKETKIANGQLVSGKLNGSILNKKITVFTWDRYGPEATKRFLDNTQRLTINWLMMHGFTVGLGDAAPTPELRDKMLEMMEKNKMEANHAITEIENNPEMLDADIFEENLLVKLNKRADIGKTTTEALNSDNNFFTMVVSGAKGSDVNIGQILGGMAQDQLKNQRIPKMVNNRALPHFFQNDDRADARGYITNSYYAGLTPEEFWFHHMTGRDGLISTAINTGKTGYMQRRLIKGLEDIMVAYDGTVRSSNNIVIQMLYSGNQINQVMQKPINLGILAMGDSEVRAKFCFAPGEARVDEEAQEMMYNMLIDLRDKMRAAQMKMMVDYITLLETYYQGVNYPRIIEDAKNWEHGEKSVSLSADYVLQELERILDHDNTPLLCISTKDKHPTKIEDEQRMKTLLRLALYEYMAPKRCIVEYKFDKQKFDMAVTEVIRTFNKALVSPGEMVGIVTAQSMGEPLTQITLSSFHKTGSGGAGQQGTPRMQELLSNSKNLATPYMYIRLKQPYMGDKMMAHKIASHLRYTLMKDLTRKIDIIYDPDVDSHTSLMRRDGIDTSSVFYLKGGDAQQRPLENMPWLYRLTLSKEAMLENDVNMLDIKTSFITFWNTNFGDTNGLKKGVKELVNMVLYGCIMTNYNNSDEPVVHIRFDLGAVDNKVLLDFYDIILNRFNLKGSESVQRMADIKEENMVSFDNEDRKYQPKRELVLYCNGIDTTKIKHIAAVDMTRTIFNDVHTVFKTFGIEAARALLVNQMNTVFVAASESVNIQHLMLMADLMTSTGGITSIDRHGITRLDTDPLARASFEVAIDQLIKAAVYNEVDKMRSVSSQIMVGRAFKGGTGLCDLVLDTDMFVNTEFADATMNTRFKRDYVPLASNAMMQDIFQKDDIDDVYLPEDDE
jgi:DNA-directed RNA polymerase II subunit RPB1